MKVTISFSNIAVNGNEENLPITALDLVENTHIHGELKFQIGDRLVPYMGFFGPGDVCFSTWLIEFENIIKRFDSANNTVYKFDEGEQSQPAYLFEKIGDKVYFSIIDAEFTDGSGDSEWQKIEFSYKEFKKQYLDFRESFLAEIKKAVPDIAEQWIEESILIRVQESH